MNTVKRQALAGLNFDNRFTRELPADPDTTNARRQVYGACYSRVRSTPVAEPRLVAYASEVAEDLDLTHEDCMSPEFREVFSGNRLLEGMDPFATCYGGHQFGQWAGQLGDGRAINLGETVSRQGSGKRYSSRAPAPRHIHVRLMGWLFCALRCGSSCVARRCITSECRRPVRSAL